MGRYLAFSPISSIKILNDDNTKLDERRFWTTYRKLVSLYVTVVENAHVKFDRFQQCELDRKIHDNKFMEKLLNILK